MKIQKLFCFSLLVIVGGCASTPTIIQTKPIEVQPPPVVVNNAPTAPYVVPADTAVNPVGQTVITPKDTGYVAVDSSNGAKVVIRVHLHAKAPPTVSVVANPPPAIGYHTDTLSGKIQTVTINKPTFGQYALIIFVTIGVMAIVLAVLAFMGKIKPL